MTTITINVDKGFDAYSIAESIRHFKGVRKVEVQDAEPRFERIPGLAYTKEERIASVRKGMEDVRAGRTISLEELERRMATW